MEFAAKIPKTILSHSFFFFFAIYNHEEVFCCAVCSMDELRKVFFSFVFCFFTFCLLRKIRDETQVYEKELFYAFISYDEFMINISDIPVTHNSTWNT